MENQKLWISHRFDLVALLMEICLKANMDMGTSGSKFFFYREVRKERQEKRIFLADFACFAVENLDESYIMFTSAVNDQIDLRCVKIDSTIINS